MRSKQRKPCGGMVLFVMTALWYLSKLVVATVCCNWSVLPTAKLSKKAICVVATTATRRSASYLPRFLLSRHALYSEV